MNALEKVRNCVAHNRAPSNDELQKFESARVAIQEATGGFFTRSRESQR
jgi:hypothetical protein